jgi:hypothetical protein
MREDRNSGNGPCYNKQCQPHQQNLAISFPLKDVVDSAPVRTTSCSMTPARK